MTETTRQALGLRSRLSERVPTTPTEMTVLGGDLIALFAFVAVGQYSHGYFFWEFPVRTVVILSPLVVPWLGFTALTGLTTESALANYRRTALKIVSGWILVAILGGAIRRTSLIPGNAPPSFIAVTVVIGLLFVGGWRVVATVLLR